MNKSCITLISFYHQDMLAFDILAILAKPEPWPQHQKFVVPTLRAESCNPSVPLPRVYMTCGQKYILPL